jgi:hypothetical protein
MSDMISPAPIDAYPAHADDWLRLEIVRGITTEQLRVLAREYNAGRILFATIPKGFHDIPMMRYGQEQEGAER